MPEASIVITTRNRVGELRTAIESALAQDADVEILVVDDGSTDGTFEVVSTDFPSVRLVRFAQPAGLIERRNQAAGMATGPVIVSIDDDAAFTAEDSVRQTLIDIAEPGIGAVAIPHIDIRVPGASLRSVPPDTEGTWVTSTFVGTAYAVRREVFESLGGFRADFVHQGEEGDFCLRMLDAGWATRLGRSSPIHHFVSPRRDLTRMDVYGRRNEILAAWASVPTVWLPFHLFGYPVKGLRHGFRVGRPRNMVRGVLQGFKEVLRVPGSRRPVARETWRAARRLRVAGALPIAAISDVAIHQRPRQQGYGQSATHPGAG